MPRYNEVDWEKAACADMPLNLFYIFEEQARIKWIFDVEIVRKTCFACPIWNSCLRYSLEKESYGIWGGLTTQERKSLTHGEPASAFTKIIQTLLDAGIGITEIQEILDEHSRNERSLENETTS